MSKLTFKYLNIPNIDIINKELFEFASTRANNKITGFHVLSIPEFNLGCPVLSEWFANEKLNFSSCNLILTPPGHNEKNSHVDRHVDTLFDTSSQLLSTGILGINFGVFNIQDTFTAFYDYIDGEILELTTNDKIPYRFYGKANLQEIDRYTLTRPVILNTSIPHSVHNPTNEIRIALSFRFANDPWHLLC